MKTEGSAVLEVIVQCMSAVIILGGEAMLKSERNG